MDKHQRLVRQGREGQKTRQHAPPEPRKKYYLFDRLQFLLPVVRDAMRRADDDGRPEKKRRKTGGRPRPKRRDAPRSDDVQRHVDAAFDRSGGTALRRRLDDDDLSFMVSLMPFIFLRTFKSQKGNPRTRRVNPRTL